MSRLHFGKDGGLDEKALGFGAFDVALAAALKLRAFLLAGLDVIQNAFHLAPGNLRAHLGGLVERIANLQLLGARDQLANEAVVDIFMHQQAGGRAADLAFVGEDAPEGRLERGIDIAVGEDDVRRLAAQFQAEPLQVGFAGGLQQPPGRANAACEADLIDVHVQRQRFAGGLTVAGDDVEDAIGQAGLLAILGQLQRGERGPFRRLQHHGAAASQRRRHFPCGDLERIIPRHDAAHHAHRLAQRVVQEGAIHGNGFAVDFAHPAGVIAKRVDGRIDIGAARLAHRFAVLHGFEHGQLFAMLEQDFGDVPEDFFLLGGVHAAPGLALETGARGSHGAVDVAGCAIRDGGQEVTRGWVDDVDYAATLRVFAPAVDE